MLYIIFSLIKMFLGVVEIGQLIQGLVYEYEDLPLGPMSSRKMAVSVIPALRRAETGRSMEFTGQLVQINQEASGSVKDLPQEARKLSD